MLAWLGGGEREWVYDALRSQALSSYLKSFYEKSKMISPDQFRFFLDSGAYSAWSRGAVIDLDEYCAFIKANIEHIDVYACLDAIPGAPGRNATRAERELAAETTWQNYLYMRGEGLSPLPVYHYGEEPRFLDRMLTYGCDYIGIGGLVGISGPMRQLWLDEVFAKLVDVDGMPIVKTHGFGMTSVPLMFRYPWHSVDSTTWIKLTANGSVILPALRGDDFVFDEMPTIISVSTRSPKQGEAGKAGNSLSPRMREILDRWLATCEKTYDEVSSHYFHRACVNVAFFKRLSEVKAVRPFKTDTIRKSALF